MGRERIRSGKYVYFCLALLSLLAGCAATRERIEAEDMRESLAHAQKLFARKDYDASLTEYRRVLSLAGGRAPADAAFFNIGLIHADPDNPKRDVQQAVRSFNAVIAGFPQSPMADHARIWVAVLDDSDRAKQELETSKQMIERSKLEVERSKQLAEKARQDAELSRQETEKTREVMEKSKRVDFEIEQKRRERVR